MKCTLVGSRYFGASVFTALRKDGIAIARVVAPAADDRLAVAAKAADVPVHILANPKIVPADAIPEGTDLIVAAHTHARVSNEALARSRLGGIGYHPSLLPRHRGIAAVEWTIMQGDPIAGGSVYHLADGWDAGAVAAQDWCFVGKGETARELWERALAPMGLALLVEGRAPCRRARQRAIIRAGRTLRNEGADAPAHGFAHRGKSTDDHIARGDRDRSRPSRHRLPARGARAGTGCQLGGQPDGEPGGPVRRHGAFRSAAGERRRAGRSAAPARVAGVARADRAQRRCRRRRSAAGW